MEQYSRSRSEVTEVLEGAETEGSFAYLARKGVVQVVAGISAATVAASLTQPLDTVKTRVQLQMEDTLQHHSRTQSKSSSNKPSYASVARELKISSGYRIFQRDRSQNNSHGDVGHDPQLSIRIASSHISKGRQR